MSTYEELYVGFCSDVNGGGNPPGIHTTASFDGEACRGECSSYSTCTGYNFLPSGGGCFLWEVSDAPSGWTQMNPSSGWTASSSIGGTRSTHHNTASYGQCYRKHVSMANPDTSNLILLRGLCACFLSSQTFTVIK